MGLYAVGNSETHTFLIGSKDSSGPGGCFLQCKGLNVYKLFTISQIASFKHLPPKFLSFPSNHRFIRLCWTCLNEEERGNTSAICTKASPHAKLTRACAYPTNFSLHTSRTQNEPVPSPFHSDRVNWQHEKSAKQFAKHRIINWKQCLQSLSSLWRFLFLLSGTCCTLLKSSIEKIHLVPLLNPKHHGGHLEWAQ